jgi:hypothetical protein
VTSIQVVSPRADGGIAGYGAEARDAFLDRELEEECQGLFFGRALESGRTAGCAILSGIGGLTDLITYKIKHVIPPSTVNLKIPSHSSGHGGNAYSTTEELSDKRRFVGWRSLL